MTMWHTAFNDKYSQNLMAENYSTVHEKIVWDDVRLQLASKNDADVKKALFSESLGIDDFMALISPAALPYLEQMAQKSYQLTRQRFGKTIQLFVPLYLSNKCHNICTYCGFSLNNPIRRTTLSEAQLEKELEAINKLSFEHVVLLTGEAPGTVGMQYFRNVLPKVKRKMAHVSMEVQPLDEKDYEELIALGLDAVYVYQETYHQGFYAKHHLRGNKQDFTYRLDTADRLGRAGIKKIGLAALIGLSNDWRADVAMSAMHLFYLQKKYWRTRYSISLPRLRPCEGGITPFSQISDQQMVQLVCAWRMVFPEIELSLSTREPAILRNNLVKLGITSISAASSTRPGGYAEPTDKAALAQFDINDNRSVAEVVDMVKSAGMEVVWRDCELMNTEFSSV